MFDDTVLQSSYYIPGVYLCMCMYRYVRMLAEREQQENLTLVTLTSTFVNTPDVVY